MLISRKKAWGHDQSPPLSKRSEKKKGQTYCFKQYILSFSMIQLVGFFKCSCDNTALRLCSTVEQCFLLPLIPPHFANSFCFSISFFLGLLQPPSPLFIAFLRLSSLLTNSLCSSWSCKHPVSRGRVLVPRSHSHVPSISGTFSPQAPGGFEGHNHSKLLCLLLHQAEDSFDAEVHRVPWHYRSSWGLPPQEVCSCSERYQRVTTPRTDLLEVKIPSCDLPVINDN